ncbi:hypothetical protein CXG81DRAFT_26675 [Caulochytrium protostelioides]|uniref:Ribosomal protein bL31m N-terminal domain-containing protein n=1 Tax=Caulochytrium protostelioides TaxID=1555241 RepID=A0A4P9X623_9FUNG|nr:hypothetical protein CXG81DRAFT_26675 [Caulochytrium protostelioides]|eukprot:RKP00614.1 hypothetical protein CXG81DRAFT_26675 [Caulochytrium protostelioides]
MPLFPAAAASRRAAAAAAVLIGPRMPASRLVPRAWASASAAKRPADPGANPLNYTVPATRLPFFNQTVAHSDGATFTIRTTSPKPILKLIKDTRNHPLWNVSGETVDQSSPELRRFEDRFGRMDDLAALYEAAPQAAPAAPAKPKTAAAAAAAASKGKGKK